MNLTEKLRSFFQDGNNREISTNILLTFLIKGCAMLISVLIVPAYARYFSNDDVYGAWLTVASVFVWINMFDFGIGNGLRNCLVKSIAAKDDEASKRYISSSYISVGVLSLVFLLVGCLGIALIDWNSVMKVSPAVVSPTVFKMFLKIIYSGVVVHFFFLLISSICYALQKTFLPGLISLITQIMLLLFLYIPNGQGTEAKVISLSIAYFLSYNLPILVVTILIFSKELRKSNPSFKMFDKSAAKEVIGLGGMFFIIQLALIALNSSNEIYINIFFKPSDVVQYNYYHKLFYIILVALTLILQPIWSAVTKAQYEKRYKWIKKTYILINGISLAFCMCSVLLAFLYQPISDIWLGKGILTVDIFSLALFVVFNTQSAIINTANCFANGFGKLKSQTVLTVMGAIIKLPAAILMAKFIGSWQAIMLATVVAQVPLTIVQPVVIYRHIKSLNIEGKTLDIKEN